jgi:hypothetical protein
MGPPDAVERRPSAGSGALDNHTDPAKNLKGHDTPVLDLFGQPIKPSEPSIPRRGSAEYLKHFLALRLPNGWKFWSLAPTMQRMPQHIESIWVLDHEGEHRHLFVDQVTGREYRFDPADGWSS